MLQVNRTDVDMDYIARHAKAQGLLDIWEAILARLREPSAEPPAGHRP